MPVMILGILSALIRLGVGVFVLILLALAKLYGVPAETLLKEECEA